MDVKNPLSGIGVGRSMVQSAQQAMVPQSDGLHIGPFDVTPLGLKLNAEATESAWVAFMTRLKPVVSGLQWIVGDWINLGELTWGKTYAEMAELTGLEEKTLRDYAYVARNVDLSIRIDKLSFAHHQLVAARPPSDQQAWLQYAAQEGYTVADLRLVLHPKQPTTATPLDLFQRKLITWRKQFKPSDAGQRLQYAALLRQMADEIERGE